MSERAPAVGRGPGAARRSSPPLLEGLTIRRARGADLDVIQALRLALLRETLVHPLHGRLRADAARVARQLYAEQLRARDEVIFLAERRGRPVGLLRCARSRGLPMLEPREFGYVSSAYVVPAARRRGTLRALLGAAERWCRRRGITELRLHSSAASAVANAAWDALGFTVTEFVRARRLD